MEFIAALCGAWILSMLTETFKIGYDKPAKNYKELMEKESFRLARELKKKE